jgi:hypothetical protein
VTTEKKKPMTNAEKKARAQVREELRKTGLLPPIKRPLNRKRFVADAKKEFEGAMDVFTAYERLDEAIGFMLAEPTPGPEQVGVAKMLKIAVEINRFMEEKKTRGELRYTVKELYDRLEPISKA